MALATFDIVLSDIRQLTPQVKHFIFSRQDGAVFDFLPGQFVTLHFQEGEKVVRRSYSLASRQTQSVAHVEFAVSEVQGGFATERLFALKPGAVLQASGPYGRLVLSPADVAERFLLLSTGTGVTPYRTMLNTLLARLQAGEVREVVLLHGVREASDLLYEDEFRSMALQHSGFSYRPCLSRIQEASADFLKGYVQDQLPALGLSSETDLVYLCGNPNMVDQAMLCLKSMAFVPGRIRREKYVS